VARYLLGGGEQATVAVALYGGVILCCALSFSGLYAWVTHDERLLQSLPPPEVVRAARLRFSVGIGAYAVAFGLAWVSAPLALGLHAAMALYYAFDQATISVDEGAAMASESA
jgi:hypothetical protein